MAAVFVEVRELSDEETLTYLHSTISTSRHRVRMPEVPAYLDALLPDQAFTPGDIPMLGRHYVPACTITGFPGSTVPGILDQLKGGLVCNSSRQCAEDALASEAVCMGYSLAQ